MPRTIPLPTVDDTILLTFEETRYFLRISRSTLYRLIDAGKLPFTRVGSHRRFHRADIELYLQSGRQIKTA